MFRVPKLASPLLLLAVIPLTAVATDSNAHRPRGVNWSDTVWVPAYDPTLGVPHRVSLRYQRWSVCHGSVENPAPRPCGVEFTHCVTLELALRGGRVLDTAERSGYAADYLAAFDGEMDYDGDSGCVLGPLGLEERTLVLDDPEDIAFFERRAGLVPLTFTAIGEGYINGPQGLKTEIDMRVGVRVVCEYTYDR